MSRSEEELFSFHVYEVSLITALFMLLFPLYKKNIQGLKHSESFFTMNLGEPIFSLRRYCFRKIACYCWWENLEAFQRYNNKNNLKHWFVLLRPYRKWGSFKAIDKARLQKLDKSPSGEVFGITIARLKLSQTMRFAKWGKPVERQVRDHNGRIKAFACLRPPNTFCTFSIWNSEGEMENMVQNSAHFQAMQEQDRALFHYEFTTMRFVKID